MALHDNLLTEKEKITEMLQKPHKVSFAPADLQGNKHFKTLHYPFLSLHIGGKIDAVNN